MPGQFFCLARLLSSLRPLPQVRLSCHCLFSCESAVHVVSTRRVIVVRSCLDVISCCCAVVHWGSGSLSIPARLCLPPASFPLPCHTVSCCLRCPSCESVTSRGGASHRQRRLCFRFAISRPPAVFWFVPTVLPCVFAVSLLQWNLHLSLLPGLRPFLLNLLRLVRLPSLATVNRRLPVR